MRALTGCAILLAMQLAGTTGYAQQTPAEMARRLLELERALKEQERVIAQNRALLLRNQRTFTVHQEALQNQARAIVQQQQQIKQSEQAILQLRSMISALSQGLPPGSRPGTSPPATPSGQGTQQQPRSQPPASQPAQQPPRSTTEGSPRAAERAEPRGDTGPPSEQGVTERAGPPQSEENAPPKPPDVAAVPERAGVLTQRGTLVVETGVAYTLSSVNRVEIAGFSVLPAINIGSFDITEVDRRSVVASTGLRYGIDNRWEAEIKVPYVHREDTTTSRPIGVGSSDETSVKATGSNLGDIELSTRHQLNDGTGGWPFLIGSLGLKTVTGTDPFEVSSSPTTDTELATGTGFWSVSTGVSFLMPSDPAVLFGGLSYNYVVPRSVEGFGRIKPGDSIGANVGFGFALNENLSFSLGTSYNVVLKTEIDGEVVPNSEVLEIGNASIGFSYRLSDRMSLNFTIEQGLTEDAPDVSYRLRVPIKYQLFD